MLVEKDVIENMDLDSIDDILIEIHSKIFFSNSDLKELYSTLQECGTIRRLNGSKSEAAQNIEYTAPHIVYWLRSESAQE
ncbi:hypothetical protein [Halorubrum sp. Ea1]|uniref:hypothetical protein n=1 Tax=Halorubrum sp. Ea1 TaxID=1480718 RepID=UPI0011400306|nr:hypothetical protein [Halorubrum sp. Ea1]